LAEYAASPPGIRAYGDCSWHRLRRSRSTHHRSSTLVINEDIKI
jgi:hypothetical protein